MPGAATNEMPALTFDPLSPEVVADPYPHYDRLRAADPVCRMPFDAWFLTRYEDVDFVLRDRRFGKDFERNRAVRGGSEPILAALSRMLIYLDPPDHTRVRGLVTHGFSAKRVQALRPRVRALADALIDEVRPNGRMDVVADYAFPLASGVIAELVGIPTEDRSAFFGQMPVFGRAIDAVPMSPQDTEKANDRMKYLEEYFLGRIAARRREPGDDLITDLLAAQGADGTVSEQELISNVMLLFGAGYETTANLIGNALVALYQHPGELARVKADLSAIATGMDELLRYGASVQFGGRTALEDVEIGGKLIKRGEIVLVSLGAANRDPALFPDPHRLDLTRHQGRPFSFGGGIHFCLGAQLARMEIEIALTRLFEALPKFELRGLSRLDWKPSFLLRGLTSLTAEW